jgi:asparagine synthase (glutamine-hydrolysing)
MRSHDKYIFLGGSLLWIDSGAQPLVNEEGTVSLAVNGEIYNHRILRKSLKKEYNFKTHSDCEVIIPLVRIKMDKQR